MAKSKLGPLLTNPLRNGSIETEDLVERSVGCVAQKSGTPMGPMGGFPVGVPCPQNIYTWFLGLGRLAHWPGGGAEAGGARPDACWKKVIRAHRSRA